MQLSKAEYLYVWYLIRNKNVQLCKAEFLGFLHPEVEPHMGDILVSETMADLDKVSN